MPQQGLVTEDGTQLDPKVVKVMRALRQVESGGNYNATGDGGAAKGAFQYNETTGPGWSNLAKQYLGDANAPMDRANQNKVTYHRIKQWKDEGKQPEEIAALWNGAKKNSDGTYTYNNPHYGEQFRSALSGFGGAYQPPPEVTPFVPAPTSIPQATGDNLRGDLSKRFDAAKNAYQKFGTGEMGYGRATLRTGGAVAGAITDVAGRAIQGILPEKAKEEIGNTAQSVSQSPGGQFIGKEWKGFVEKHPEGAQDVRDVANIAGLLPIGGGAGLAGKTEGILARGATESALKPIIADVTPKLGAKAAASSIASKGTTKSYFSGLIKPNVDKNAVKVAEAVQKNVPNFSKLKTFSDKLNAVKSAKDTLGESLKQQVVQAGKNIVYPFKELNARLARIEKPIAIKSDVTLNKQFDLAREAALRIAREKGGTIESLFEARKAFDDLVDKQFPTLYDRANAPMRDAITAIRREMNDFVAEQLPDVMFKDSLKSQSRLFDAIDTLAPKALEEIGTTRLGRFAERHPLVTKTAKKLGEGALIATGGGALYSGYKHLTD